MKGPLEAGLLTHQPHPKVERKLESLREQVLRMGHLAEAILDKSLRAVWERDPVLAGEVKQDDLPIDMLDLEIDQAVLEVLALQAPVAQDLRQVIAIKTAATDLERVGDLARNIAKSAARLAEREAIPVPSLLKTLASESQAVLKNSISALADLDPESARAVLAADDKIDEDEDEAIRASIASIHEHPEHTEQEVDFILIAKSLERVGDHATNIAEDVILVAESKNLKHAGKLET